MGEDKKPKSPILREIRKILVEGIRRIDEGNDCSEAQAIGLLSRFNSESKGFVDKRSTVNYDGAMRMLGMKNRNDFKRLCDNNGIEQVKINNQPIGFLVSEIESLKPLVKSKKK